MTETNPLVDQGNRALKDEVLASERGGSGWDGFGWHLAVGALAAVSSGLSLHFLTDIDSEKVIRTAGLIGFVSAVWHALTPAKR